MPSYKKAKKQQKQKSPTSTQETAKHNLVSLEGMPYGEYIPDPVRQSVEKALTQGNVAMEKATEVFNENLPKVKKFYSETLEPTVAPVIKVAMEKHEQNPEVAKIVFSAITVFYGGCFPKMAIAYAALGMTDVSEVYGKVKSNPAGGFSVTSFLKEQTPESLNKIVMQMAIALFVLLAVLRSPLCAALVIGSSLVDLNWDLACIVDPLVQGKIKTYEALGENKDKWAPLLSRWVIKAAAFLAAYLLPMFTTAFYVAMLGSRTVAKHLTEKVKIAEKTLAADVAIVGTLLQTFWGYSATYGSMVLFPLMTVEGML